MSFNLVSAAVINASTVDLTFSTPIDTALPLITSPGSYDIDNGLKIRGVVILTSTKVRVYTSTQTPGIKYVVRCIAALIDNAGDPITNKSSSFVGVDPGTPFTVTGLQARTGCEGRTIHLSWTNPEGTAWVRIVRRKESWPFDLTDSHDVVLEVESDPTSFTDTGLEEQTYYYYLVLAMPYVGPDDTDIAITDDSRAMGLSIAEFDGVGWLWKNTPMEFRKLDARPLSEGGGDGFLAKWYAVLGCWLNLMKGTINAAQLLADADKAPFHSLTAKSIALGVTPEGFSYDYSIVRRPLLSLVNVYHRKGTCPGIVETVRMFTLWDAECVELGFAECRHGPNPLTTWDDSAVTYVQSFSVTSMDNLEFICELADDGTGVLAAPSWIDDQWKSGRYVSVYGEICCIDLNRLGSSVHFSVPDTDASLDGEHSAGDFTITVDTTYRLRPGMEVQITHATLPATAEIVEVRDILSATQFRIKTALVNTYPDASAVSLGKSLVRREILLSGAASGSTMTVALAAWSENQWKGFKFIDASDNLRTIVSNTGNVLTLDGACATGQFAISYNFGGVTFAARNGYWAGHLELGETSHLYYGTFDHEMEGTRHDPFNRTWHGAGTSTVLGAWGPNDIGVYIKTKVTQLHGVGSTASGGVLDLDPDVPAPTPGDLVGMYLNPNQNQEQMFLIVANDATTITVAGDVSSLVRPGQYYYVLKPRDAQRFKRISARLRNEFTDADVVPHVLFF